MKASRLTRIERRLMESEYELDSLIMHVTNVGCEDVKPRSLKKIIRAVNAIKSARALVRKELGVTQWTLFAGGQGSRREDGTSWPGRKSWSQKRPHGWRKDCDEP